jgi:hypothetical protein
MQSQKQNKVVNCWIEEEPKEIAGIMQDYAVHLPADNDHGIVEDGDGHNL